MWKQHVEPVEASLLSYLLEASLNQVLREEVSDKVKKGIKTGNLIILGSFS